MKNRYFRKSKYAFSVSDNMFVYLRSDRVLDMLVKVLGNIVPKIQKEEDIPYALSNC